MPNACRIHFFCLSANWCSGLLFQLPVYHLNLVLDFFKQNIYIVFFHTLPSYFTLFFLFLLSQIIVRITFRLFRLRVRCEQT